MRILVVEDEPATRSAVCRGLAAAGFAVDEARDGTEAELFLEQRHYDAVVLDRRLPDVSGDAVLARLRRRGVMVPVLMLTALDRVSDRVTGLEAGADDYLVKPFAFEELLARLRALIRRSSGTYAELSFDDLALDREGVAVRRGSRRVLLTPREFDILQKLMQAGGRPVSARSLMDAAWPEPCEASEEALWSHVANLRRKLQLVGSQVGIRCRRQVGYFLARTPGAGEPGADEPGAGRPPAGDPGAGKPPEGNGCA